MYDNSNTVVSLFSNNVIQFPEARIAEVAAEHAAEEKFETLASSLINEVFFKLMMYGYDVSGKDTFYDCILAVESIKSLIMKSEGIYYPLQDLAKITNPEYDEDSDDEGEDIPE